MKYTRTRSFVRSQSYAGVEHVTPEYPSEEPQKFECAVVFIFRDEYVFHHRCFLFIRLRSPDDRWYLLTVIASIPASLFIFPSTRRSHHSPHIMSFSMRRPHVYIQTSTFLVPRVPYLPPQHNEDVLLIRCQFRDRIS